MPRSLVVVPAVVAAVALVPCRADAARLQTAIEGLSSPTYVTSEPAGASRLYAVERGGAIRVARCGTTPEPTPFLTLGSELDADYPEEGLLSMAFAPDYATSGLLYIAYTRVVAGSSGNDLVIEERRRSASNPLVADPAYRREVVVVQHRQNENHNGGQLQFDRDGKLWLGTGDGGGGNDPAGNAQNRSSPLGKLHVIDVATGALTQRAYGLRNPWRFSFDRATGDLTVGDVGQNAVEEIDWVPAANLGSVADFGWDVMEGNRGDPSGLGGDYVAPRVTHTHGDGWVSITGGYVVRDPSVPDLAGRYLYADYGKGDLHSADLAAGTTVATGLHVAGVSSFGEDASGRVYVASLDDGTIRRVIGDSATPAPGGTDCGAAADTSAPVLRLRVAKRQRALRRRAVLVRGTASEGSTLTASARLGGLSLGGTVRSLAAGRSFTARLRLGTRARASLRRSLRRGRPRTIVIRLRARDAAGNRSTREIRVRVVG